MPGRRGRLRIGTSGYEYADWKGRFYPPDLARREWFSFYAATFDTVEVNASFYRLPSSEVFDRWRARAQAGFLYALKFSRYGTHLKRLLDPEQTIGLFLERAERLGPHLGPVLVQLPPRWKVDAERLDRFLQAAPRRHRWAVELRDPSWLHPDVYTVLERHRAALVVHDLLPRHPRVPTAGWTYLRFHGVAYGGSYSPQKLAAEARRIRAELGAGRDVYAYFNNDRRAAAVHDARRLRRLVLDP